MGSLPIGISGSRAATILGMSPWSTPFQVWQDIMEARQPGFNASHGYDYTPFEGNASTRWGLAFEDAVIKLCEEKAGNKILDREGEYSHLKNDFVTCHIDGSYRGTTILHEGKTTTSYGFGDKWGDPGTDKIPIEIQIQVQHQMLCTGADSAIVSVLVFPKRPDDWENEGWVVLPQPDDKLLIGLKTPCPEGEYSGISKFVDPISWAATLSDMGFFHQYTIPANRDLHALMLDEYRKWWELYVIGETPPAPQNYDDIRALITAPTGTIIVDSNTARWFKEYKDLGSEIGATGNLAKRRDQLKVLILDRAYVREHEMCPHDRMLDYKTCHGQCGLPECSVGTGKSVLDDESTDKWIFMDDRGRKLGSYGRTSKGNMTFR